MPILDMPLGELKKYKGTNPKPKDFDVFWDRKIKEAKDCDLEFRFSEADFKPRNVLVKDVLFKAADGSQLYARYFRQQTEEKVPVIIMFHGYGGFSGDYQDKLSYVSQGFAVLAVDTRGQGGKSEDRTTTSGTTKFGHIVRGLENPDNMLFVNAYQDSIIAVRLAKALKNVDENNIYVLGGSQGGGLGLACAALNPEVKRAVILYPFLCDFKRVYEMDLLRDAYGEIREYLRLFAPRLEQVDAVFDRLGYIDVQHLASRIQAEVLWGIGLYDSVCPPSTQFAAYNKIKTDKSMIIYPQHGHEWLPYFADRGVEFFLKP